MHLPINKFCYENVNLINELSINFNEHTYVQPIKLPKEFINLPILFLMLSIS